MCRVTKSQVKTKKNRRHHLKHVVSLFFLWISSLCTRPNKHTTLLLVVVILLRHMVCSYLHRSNSKVPMVTLLGWYLRGPDKGPKLTLSDKVRHVYSLEYQGLQFGTLFVKIAQVFTKLYPIYCVVSFPSFLLLHLAPPTPSW